MYEYSHKVKYTTVTLYLFKPCFANTREAQTLPTKFSVNLENNFGYLEKTDFGFKLDFSNYIQEKVEGDY